MNALRPSLVSALVVLALSSAPARAQDPVADLAGLLTEAARSANPSMAFLRGVGGLGDVDLDQAQVRAALTRAGIGSGNMLEKILGPTQRITKKGDRVRIKRSEKTLIALAPKGAIELGKDIEVRLRLQSSTEASIDKVDGIRVGESADGLYALWEIAFKEEGGHPVAKVTAGKLVFSKTVTIDLSPRTPPPGAPAPTPTTPTPGAPAPSPTTPTNTTPTTATNTTPTTGITDALSGAAPSPAAPEVPEEAPAVEPATPPSPPPPGHPLPSGGLGD